MLIDKYGRELVIYYLGKKEMGEDTWRQISNDISFMIFGYADPNTWSIWEVDSIIVEGCRPWVDNAYDIYIKYTDKSGSQQKIWFNGTNMYSYPGEESCIKLIRPVIISLERGSKLYQLGIRDEEV